MPTSLQGRAQQAARQQGSRFRTRSGRLNEEFLQQGWCAIRQDAAAGVEHGRAQADEQHLDANIRQRQCGRYAWVVEADIKQCFETIDHDWMRRL